MLPQELWKEIALYLYRTDFLTMRLVAKNIPHDPVSAALENMTVSTGSELSRYGYIFRVPHNIRYHFEVMKYDYDTMYVTAYNRFIDTFSLSDGFIDLIKAHEPYASAYNRLSECEDSDYVKFPITNQPVTLHDLHVLLKPRWYDLENKIKENLLILSEYCCYIIENEWREIRDSCISGNIYLAIEYCAKFIGARIPYLEARIAGNHEYMNMYLSLVLREAWPEQETYIATNAQLSMLYAHRCLNGRFVAGEQEIFADNFISIRYVFDVLKQECPEAENALFESASNAEKYIVEILNKRHEGYEQFIVDKLKTIDISTIKPYDQSILAGLWIPEINVSISSRWLVRYTIEYRKCRWPEIESYIAEFYDANKIYMSMFNDN